MGADEADGRPDPLASPLVRCPGDPELVLGSMGPYTLVRKLARGGMGTVYLAFRTADQHARRVAIKVVRRGLDTEDVLKRFEFERHVLTSLNHPSIARVFDAGVSDDGSPYFVMEYVDGMPIDRYCDAQKLTTAERLKLFQKVCQAVHYAHQNLLVHRDLKPGNILVTSDGEPKLLDFGIAKALNPDMIGVPIATAPEVVLMTPEYASPEQAMGNPLTTASDVYALGVLLYELLTGHRPYQIAARVREEVIRVICETEPERPSTRVAHAESISLGDGTSRVVAPEEIAQTREGVPQRLRRRLAGDIDNIVLMALRKSPRRRYQSAQQLAEDLDRHLAGLPVIARPDTWRYRTGKLIRRNRGTVVAVVAVITSLAGGLAVAERGWASAKRQRAQAIAAQQRFSTVVRTFLSDMTDEVAGSTEARKILADRTASMIRDLEKSAPDDPSLRLDLARAEIVLAQALGFGGSNLGRNEDASAHLRRGIEGYRALTAEDPTNADLLAELALAQCALVHELPLTASKGGESAEAVVLQARENAEKAKSLAPGTLPALRAEAITKTTAAGLLDRNSDQRELLEESLAARKAIQRDYPSDRADRELSVGYIDLGNWYYGKPNKSYDLALENYNEALDLRDKLEKSRQKSWMARRDTLKARQAVCKTLRRLDQARHNESDQSRMRTLHRQCVETAAELYKENPSNMQALQDLVQVEAESMYYLLDTAGDAAGALSMANDLASHGEELLRANASNPAYAYAAANAELAIGKAMKRNHLEEKARMHVGTALDVLAPFLRGKEQNKKFEEFESLASSCRDLLNDLKLKVTSTEPLPNDTK